MDRPIAFQSKLPNVGTTIFTVMSKMAKDHQAINLSQGFPNFDPPQRLLELAKHYMDEGMNQYAPMPGILKLRERLANKNQLLYQTSIKPETEITITAGASQGIFAAIEAFVHKGEEVIIIEPAFDIYKPAIELQGGVVVPYCIEAPDFKINYDQFAQLISPKTRMIILNTPHNPTGAVLEQRDWLAIEKLVKHTNILIISDEVYEHITFDGKPHESILKYPSLWNRAIVAFSFGKTFHCTGWKMGYVTAPDYLMKEIRKNHQFNIFCVTNFLQHAIADFLEGQSYYQSLPQFFQKKRDLFSQLLEESQFQLIPSYGSYFQLADYSQISQENDVDFAKRMTQEYGVAVIPISVFYSNPPKDQLIRFCFAKTDEILIKAGERLCKI